MATSKNTVKKKVKSAVKAKSTGMAAGKKKTTTRAKKASAPVKSKAKTTSKKVNPAKGNSPQDAVEFSLAHMNGHKKMNLKKDYNLRSSTKTMAESLSATNKLSRGDLVARKESPQRRIISGASLNKKGRLF